MHALNMSQKGKSLCTYIHVYKCLGMRRRYAESPQLSPPAAMFEPDQAGDVTNLVGRHVRAGNAAIFFDRA